MYLCLPMKESIKPNQNHPDTKKNQVTKMFDGISKSYDILNRIITLGIDVIWRKRVVRLLKKEQPKSILDIATGTGDLVIELASIDAEKIIGLDISPGMLEIGRQKVKKNNLDNRIEMQLGDSEALIFEDSSFDGVTIAFGVRNFENLDLGLQEIFRVFFRLGLAKKRSECCFCFAPARRLDGRTSRGLHCPIQQMVQ